MNHILDSIGNQGGKLPTVVVTANDNQAVGVARACMSMVFAFHVTSVWSGSMTCRRWTT